MEASITGTPSSAQIGETRPTCDMNQCSVGRGLPKDPSVCLQILRCRNPWRHKVLLISDEGYNARITVDSGCSIRGIRHEQRPLFSDSSPRSQSFLQKAIFARYDPFQTCRRFQNDVWVSTETSAGSCTKHSDRKFLCTSPGLIPNWRRQFETISRTFSATRVD